jgi:psiF repeat-containing protein
MATKDTAEATMSPEEKAKVDNAGSCEQQATQKGLKGTDRKDFMKTCKGGEAAPK